MFGSYDITFCDNENCKKRKTCERRTDRLKNYPYPVSMLHFEPDKKGKCDEYLKKEVYKPKTVQEKADVLYIQYILEHMK